MSNPWEEADARAQAAVDFSFGEPVRIEPQLAGEYSASQPDQSRPPATVTGNVSTAVDDTALKGAMRGGEQIGGTRVAISPTEVWLSDQAFSEVGYEIRPGDMVVLSGRYGLPRYVVVRVFEPGIGGRTLYLAGDR